MATIVPSHPLLNLQLSKRLGDGSFGMLQREYMKSGAWRNRWWFNSEGFCFSVNELFDLLKRNFIYSFVAVPRCQSRSSMENLIVDLDGFLASDAALESVGFANNSSTFFLDARFSIEVHGKKGNSSLGIKDPFMEAFNVFKTNSLSVLDDWLVATFANDFVKFTLIPVWCLETNSFYDLDNKEQKAVAAKLASAIQNQDTTVFSQPVDAVACYKSQPCGAKTQSSMLSNLWRKYLGDTLIPFDQSSRDALIQKACEHSELRVHIEKWKKLRG